MTGEQRGLLEADLVSMQHQRDDAKQRERAAEEAVYQAQAQRLSAHLDVGILSEQIDQALEELHALKDEAS